MDFQREKALDYLNRQAEVKRWMEKVIGEIIPMKNTLWSLHQSLQDGVFICRVAEKMEEDCIPNICLNPKTPIQKKENILYFLTAVEEIGIPRSSLFKLSDLHDLKRHMFLPVLICLEELALFSEIPLEPLSEYPSWTEQEIENAYLDLEGHSFPPRRLMRKQRKGTNELEKVIGTIPKKEAAIRVTSALQNLDAVLSQSVVRGMIFFQSFVRGRIARRKFQKRVTNQAHRRNVAKEIVKTEEAYINNLTTLIEVFQEPLLEAVKNGKPILKQKHIKTIFHDSLSVIVNYNKELLSKLKPRVEEWTPWQCLGDIFLQFTGFLKAYTQYVTDFSTVLSTYEMKRHKSKFSQFLMDCKLNPRTEYKELDSFLIEPIQRIPRYGLLLKELIKHTWEDHRDYSDLQLALEKMQDVAFYMNERKREVESMEKILEIQNKCTKQVNLVGPQRKFVREDILKIDEDGQGKERIFILFSDKIMIAKPSLIRTNSIRVEKLLDLPKIKICVQPKESNTTIVKIHDNYNNLLLKILIQEEKENWIDDLKKIKESHDRQLQEKHDRAFQRSEKKAQEAKDMMINKYKNLGGLPSASAKERRTLRSSSLRNGSLKRISGSGFEADCNTTPIQEIEENLIIESIEEGNQNRLDRSNSGSKWLGSLARKMYLKSKMSQETLA